MNYALAERQIEEKLHQTNQIAALATPMTVEQILASVDIERRPTVAVHRGCGAFGLVTRNICNKAKAKAGNDTWRCRRQPADLAGALIDQERHISITDNRNSQISRESPCYGALSPAGGAAFAFGKIRAWGEASTTSLIGP